MCSTNCPSRRSARCSQPPPAPRAAASLVRAFDPDRGWRSAAGLAMEVLGRALRGDRNAIRPLPLAAVAAPFEAAGFAVSVSPCWGNTPLPNVLLVAERRRHENRRRSPPSPSASSARFSPPRPAAAQPTERRPLFEAGVFGGGGWIPDYPAAGQNHCPRPRAALRALSRRDPAERRPRRARPLLPQRRPGIQPELQRRPRRPLARQPRPRRDAGPRLPRRGRPRTPLGSPGATARSGA